MKLKYEGTNDQELIHLPPLQTTHKYLLEHIPSIKGFLSQVHQLLDTGGLSSQNVDVLFTSFGQFAEHYDDFLHEYVGINTKNHISSSSDQERTLMHLHNELSDIKKEYTFMG